MERKAIELGGIIRNLPDNTVKDGMFHELINLRPKDGALRPVGTKDYIDVAPRSVLYIHRISDTLVVYIGGEDPTYLTYWVWDEAVPSISAGVVTAVAKADNMSFGVLKNALLVSNHTTELMSCWLFNEEDLEYKIINSPFLPVDMPEISITRVSVSGDDATDDFEVPYTTDPGEALLSQYVKMQNEKANDGYLSGRVLVRCAWELFDGALIKHTIPDLVLTSDITVTHAADGTLFGGDGGWNIDTEFKAYKLQFQLLTDNTWLTAFKSLYENIIRSLKIYVSLPKSPENNVVRGDIKVDESKLPLIAKKALEKIERTYDVVNIKNYDPDPAGENWYLLKDIRLSDLLASTVTDLTPTEKAESVQDLATREQLGVDNFSHHYLFGERLFSYNERIFAGDIKNYLYRGFPIGGLLSYQYPQTTGAAYEVAIEYEIIVAGGKILKALSAWAPCNWYDYLGSGAMNFSIRATYNAGVLMRSSYFGYPDSRATKARILVRQGGVIKLIHTQPLESHNILNFAITRGINVNGLFSSLTEYTPDESAYTYYDHDRIQATEINNPFYYPAINSYRVQGKVLGMSSNAIALSSGQFGQFPIYTFTNEGIWTMSIGTGETLINTITPLSREVCNNPLSITPIDGGTAFTSGRGLFIISGNQVIEISDIAEGKETSRLTGLAAYNALLAGPNLSGVNYAHCSVPFLTYLQGAVIGFDYANSEIIVTNRPVNANYSWVYSLKSKIWFKISQAWNRFVTDYPKLYAYDDNRTERRHDMNIENFVSSADDDLALVFGQTRPIKISGADFKKIHRGNLGGNIQNDVAPAIRFVVAVFGTTDNKTWFLLNNGRDFGTDDVMVLGRSQYSIRQIIVVFGGHIEADSYLNYLTFDFEERYGGKLR